MKLTVLGGGGVRSPFLTKSIALGAEAAGITEVVLMDNNAEKLHKYGKIAKLVGERCNPALHFILTTDAEEALRDADYIITTIRGDADEGRVFDERTALSHGVLGQETTGAGGFAMALRSIPILTGYCELARRVAKPNVLIFNFTNPSGLVTQALRTQGYDMVYGVCDAPSGFHKQLAALLGVERERFTMDEGCSEAVKEVFVHLYDKGLIYRGNRMVNWCPHCNTSISDAEVEYEEKDGHFWHLLYPVKETGEMLELATTRPETMLCDTAVAINGEDPRYAHLHGCHVILPLLNKEIPIVCDEHADMTKGTGVVKITPAHDPNDFEVGLRHDLPIVRVFTYDGHMTGAADKAAADALFAAGKNTVNEPHVLDCGKYAGMTALEARKAILADLEACGALKETEPLTHDVGTCYRCHNDVEPLISAQWFVKMEPLAKEALRVVNEGEVKFVPERFSKTYTNWMENCHDWCISRQLWWGHQIPAWTCEDCGHINVKREDPTACEKCGSTHLTREEDVLDTWFSSALWPFSTLGWPEKTEDLDYFYPTDVLVTGYDIIFFWVARMIFSGCEQMHQIPFHTVLIHGLVRDDKGRKMSKSLGNGIDPLEMAEKYGADALRFNLITGNSPGNDMRFYVEKCGAMRNFANKLWNASRFVMMNLTIDKCELPAADALAPEDKWVLSKLNTLVKEVTENLDAYEIGVASAKVYDFIWDTYCDWYIELTKTRLNGTDEDAKLTAQNVLCYVLVTLLKLLHPFMPFITEEIYQALPKCDGAEDILMTAQWPEYTEALSFPAEESAMEAVMDLIRAIRARRAEMNVPPSKKAELMIVTDQAGPYQQGLHFIQRLAYASNVTFPETAPADVTGLVSVVTHDATAYLPLSELVDLAAERERIAKELEKAKNGLRITEGKLANEKFVAHAPENVVNAEREKAAKYKELIAKLEESAKAMQA